MNIQRRVDELRPWHYCFDLNGVLTGDTTPDCYEKVDVMLNAGAFNRPIYRKVLDLGANAGMVSLWFADNKQSQVHAVEGNIIFYEQLKLVCEIKGADHITPIFGDLRHLEPPNEGYYDCVLLLGVLHHISAESRQAVVDLCYKSVNHLGEVYIQTQDDIDAESYMRRAGFITVKRICDWPGQNRVAWLCQKDPMRL